LKGKENMPKKVAEKEAPKKAKKEVKTVAVLDQQYQGKPMFQIHDQDKWKNRDEGEDIFPLVSFGVNKAVRILAHIEDLKKWVAQQNGATKTKKK
jgi:hypothetical protein